MNGHLIIFAIDVVAVFTALLLAVGNVARFPRNRNALLVAGILLGSVCTLVLGRSDYGYWIPEPYDIDVGAWEPVLNLGRNLGPGLFMLLCHSLFQERRRIPRWVLALLAVQILLEEPVHLLVGPGAVENRWLTETAPSTLQALFGVLAVHWTLAGWRSDLVELRRRMRWIILVIVGIAMAGSTLLLRVVIPWDSVHNYYAHVGLAAFDALLLAVIAFLLLDARSVEYYLNPGYGPARQAPPDAGEDADPAAGAAVARLQQLMTGERVYRESGLSVGALAKRMGLPEYRLRRLIHEQLGYRNFNAFLHDHRIREACELLRDPEQARTPILTIALSVGYQSINTFNRGFREVMGVTPSEYRAGTSSAETGVDPSTDPVSLPRS